MDFPPDSSALSWGRGRGAGEHTVLGEQAGEPPDVRDSTLRKAVPAAHERFVAVVIVDSIWGID
jgi:hypothetical protein